MPNGRFENPVSKDALRAGAMAFAIGAFVQIAFVRAAAADELQPFRNIGDGYRAVKVITSYDLHPETKTMDVVAKEPNDPSFSHDVMASLAARTVHEICANRTLRPGWTIRIFLPGESAPVSQCRVGAPSGHLQRHASLAGTQEKR